MVLLDTQLSASEVLRTFHRDEPYLFLGAAFSTVGILSGAFSLLRRRFDPLLVWLGVFAYLYGQRMWLDTGLLDLTLAGNEFFARLRWAIDFIVPIPAFLFFEAAGLLVRRGKLLTAIISVVFLSLAVTVLVVGRVHVLHTINNVLVIAALPWVLVRTFLLGRRDHDFVVIRRGLFVFRCAGSMGQSWRRAVGRILRRADRLRVSARVPWVCGGTAYTRARSATGRDPEGAGGCSEHPDVDSARGVPCLDFV